MSELFEKLASLMKPSSTEIDDGFFSLHYRITTGLFFIFSIMVSARQHFGDPIHCTGRDTAINYNLVLNSYCWAQATFIIPEANGFLMGPSYVSQGLGPVSETSQIKHQAYYQWVSLALFFQGILFYVPRYLWKMWERGMVKQLSQEMNSLLLPQSAIHERVYAIAHYFVSNRNSHNFYAMKYIFCELLNLANVVGQMYLINIFLAGEFLTYGLNIIALSMTNPFLREDAMIKLFPRAAKCTFHQYGPSGTLEIHDTLCVLPLNIINEKIYIFLWFWMVFLALLSALSIIYRIFTFIVPMRTMLLHSRGRFASAVEVQTVIKQVQYGDWFLLYLLSKNISGLAFQQLIQQLARQFTEASLV